MHRACAVGYSQDQSSIAKREAALVTLGKLVLATGYAPVSPPHTLRPAVRDGRPPHVLCIPTFATTTR